MIKKNDKLIKANMALLKINEKLRKDLKIKEAIIRGYRWHEKIKRVKKTNSIRTHNLLQIYLKGKASEEEKDELLDNVLKDVNRFLINFRKGVVK